MFFFCLLAPADADSTAPHTEREKIPLPDKFDSTRAKLGGLHHPVAAQDRHLPT